MKNQRLARLRDLILIVLASLSALGAGLLFAGRLWIAPLLLQLGLRPATTVAAATALALIALGSAAAYVLAVPPVDRG